MLMKNKSMGIGRWALTCTFAALALVLAGNANAQLALSVGTGSNSDCDATEIIVPLTVSGATNLSSFGIRVNYDTNNATFNGSARTTATQAWAGADANEGTPGVITIGGFAGAGATVTGSADLVTLSFTCNPGACPSITALTLTNPSAGTASAALTDGQLTCGTFPTVRVGTVSGSCGTSIAVPVSIENFSASITSFGFRVNYDTNLLTFTGSTRSAATQAWAGADANEGTPGVITCGGFAGAGAAVTGNTDLLFLNFDTDASNPGPNALTLSNPSAGTSTAQLADGSVSCIDNQAPVASCVASLTANLSEGSIAAADLDNGSSDPDTDPLTFSIVGAGASYSLDCADVTASPITLTLEVSDGSLTDTCDVQVTVVDDIDPTAVTQNISINLSAAGSASITPAQVDDGSSDNCGGVTLVSVVPSTFDCTDRGNNSVVLTVSDAAGNTATANATVEVLDVTPPNAVAQNIQVQLGAGGSVTVNASQVNNGSSDACGIGSITLSQTTFNCDDLGPNSVTLTVSDTNNPPLTSTANATVTVIDSIDPTAVARDVVVSLDENGVATITTDNVNNGSTDNCGTPTLSLDQTTFTCADLGANTVTLTATDGSGNTATDTATVTVLDEIGPSLDVVDEPITLTLSAAGTATLTAEAVYQYADDNCEVVEDSLTLSQTEFGCADLGENTVTVSISDSSGNTTEATVTVIVVDDIAPTAVAQDIEVQLGADGTATIVAADVDGGSTDGCPITLSIDVDSFDCSDVGSPVAVTLTATDSSGNSSTAIAQATVVDSLDPVITASATAAVALVDGAATVTVDDLVSSVTDNCGVASVDITSGQTSFTCDDLGGNFDVVVTATDTSGNIETVTVTVTVTDPNDSCVVEEGEGEGVVEGIDECTDLDENGIVDDPSICLDDDVVLGFTNVGTDGGCLVETRQVLFTNTDGSGNVTLSVPDPNNFEVTVTVTIARSAIPVGESAVFVVKVGCDLENLLAGHPSAGTLANNLTRDNVPVEEIIPGTYVLATVFQQAGDDFTEVDGVTATITYQGLDVNTVEDPQVYQHGTVVIAGEDGPETNGDTAGSWNEAGTTLEGTDVVVGVNGLSVFVVTQPAPQVPFLSVTPNATFARIVGITAVNSSRSLTFTLKNTGPGTVAGSATVTGTGFSITGDANYTLAGATTDTVTVRFAPATEGTFQGSITFTGGDNGPVTIQLWGVGSTAIKTAFFGCGAAGGAGMGFGDIAVVGLLLSVLFAVSRVWSRARQN